MKLRKLATYKDPNYQNHTIEFINVIRSHYLWSQRIYTPKDVDNVFLLIDGNSGVGFIDCHYEDTNFIFCRKVHIVLNELHISPSHQNKGYGYSVIRHLLSKGLDIQLHVVDENQGMLNLLKKFTTEIKTKLKNVTVVNILANQDEHINNPDIAAPGNPSD